jgi:hypothetical protein
MSGVDQSPDAIVNRLRAGGASDETIKLHLNTRAAEVESEGSKSYAAELRAKAKNL